MEDCLFEGNMTGQTADGARSAGGAISILGKLTAKNCDFIGNRSDDPDLSDDNFARGGAIYFREFVSSAELTGCTFKDNFAQSYGGAVAVHGTLYTDVNHYYAANVKFENCDFLNNECEGRGGAISNYGRTTIVGGEISGNSSGRYGGGIFVNTTQQAALKLADGVEITDNYAKDAGSGVYVGGEVEIDGRGGAVVVKNNSGGAEGDIYVDGGANSSLLIKGTNEIASVYLGDGKKIQRGSEAPSSDKMVIYGQAGGDIFEGGGAGAEVPPIQTGDGRYETDANGNLVAKKYPVTLNGASVGETAYGTDYTFAVSAGESVTVTVNGKKVAATDNGDGTYTVSGEAIVGALVITTKTLTAPDSVPADAEAYIMSSNGASGTFAEVLAAAVEGDTVVLRKDIALNSVIALDKSIDIKTDAAVKFTFAPGGQLAVTADVLFNGDLAFEGSGSRTAPAIAVSGSAAQLTLSGNVSISGMKNLSTASGLANGQGGAVSVTDKAGFSAANIVFENNAAYEGGAIYASGATVTLDAATFTNNTAKDNGDATNNKEARGGAIYAAGSAKVSITDSVFESNQAGGRGGVIFQGGAYVTIDGSSITQNQSERFGGVGSLYEDADTLIITDTTITNNASVGEGGGFHVRKGIATFGDKTKMSGNKVKPAPRKFDLNLIENNEELAREVYKC